MNWRNNQLLNAKFKLVKSTGQDSGAEMELPNKILDELKGLERDDHSNFQESLAIHEELLIKLHSTSRTMLQNLIVCYEPSLQTLTVDQKNSVNTLWRSMYQSLHLADVEILRKRGADALNHERKMIELAAFAHECIANPESATRWVEAVENPKRLEKYKSRFNAHQKVAEHFGDADPRTIKQHYDFCCFFVHPSLYSMIQRIKKTSAGRMALLYHERDVSPEEQSRDLVPNHAIFQALLDSFASVSDSRFDSDLWNKTTQEALELWKETGGDDQQHVDDDSEDV